MKSTDQYGVTREITFDPYGHLWLLLHGPRGTVDYAPLDLPSGGESQVWAILEFQYLERYGERVPDWHDGLMAEADEFLKRLDKMLVVYADSALSWSFPRGFVRHEREELIDVTRYSMSFVMTGEEAVEAGLSDLDFRVTFRQLAEDAIAKAHSNFSRELFYKESR